MEYKRDYQDEDIGRQINRKVELEDIFNGFRKDNQLNMIDEYIFGTEIKNSPNTSFIVKTDGEIKVSIRIQITPEVQDSIYQSSSWKR